MRQLQATRGGRSIIDRCICSRRSGIEPRAGENAGAQLSAGEKHDFDAALEQGFGQSVIIATVEQPRILIAEFDKVRSCTRLFEALPKGVEIADQPRARIRVENFQSRSGLERLAERVRLGAVAEGKGIDRDRRGFDDRLQKGRIKRDATPEERRRKLVAGFAAPALRGCNAGKICIGGVDEPDALLAQIAHEAKAIAIESDASGKNGWQAEARKPDRKIERGAARVEHGGRIRSLDGVDEAVADHDHGLPDAHCRFA